MKWGQVLDREGEFLAIMLAKGFNHHNEAESKLGKPNLHFKSFDLQKEARG
jgi:hypothetical protein